MTADQAAALCKASECMEAAADALDEAGEELARAGADASRLQFLAGLVRAAHQKHAARMEKARERLKELARGEGPPAF